jgi:hypothetical protein
MRYSDKDIAELIAHMLLGYELNKPHAPHELYEQQDDAEYIEQMKSVKIYGKNKEVKHE